MVDQPLEAVAAVAELARDVVAEHGVGDEQERHDRQFFAGGAPSCFEYQKAQQTAHVDVHRYGDAAAVGQVIVDQHQVYADIDRQADQDPVKPAGLGSRVGFSRRVQ